MHTNTVHDEIKSQLLAALSSKKKAFKNDEKSPHSLVSVTAQQAFDQALPDHLSHCCNSGTSGSSSSKLDGEHHQPQRLRPRAPFGPFRGMESDDTDSSDADDVRPIRIRTPNSKTAGENGNELTIEVHEPTYHDGDVPSQWTRYFDETYQHHYYFNEITGESMWELPPAPREGRKKKGTSPKNRKKDKEKDGKKQMKGTTKKQGPEIMPSHMLLDTGTSSDAHAVGIEELKPPSSPSFFDLNDCYSDMDEDAGDSGPYTMPTFDIPEDRLWGENPKGRIVDSPLIGGSNQDYLNMARTYKTERLYSDRNITQTCVLCNKRPASHVLFPCEHRCLCNDCILKEDICPDSKMSTKTHGHCNCPLCAAVIKKILPFEHGRESEKYWQWVYEFPPPLSEKFKKRWKHSAAVIEKVYVNGEMDDESDSNGSSDSKSCTVM